MATKHPTQSTSRRDVVRTGAALGLLAPAILGAVHPAGAQEDAVDYRGHPAVGVWSEGDGGYDIFHADGTYQLFDPWAAMATGQGDPSLPTLGFGVWQPISKCALEATLRIAWLDTSVTSLLTYRVRMTVAESGMYSTLRYRGRLTDASGNEMIRGSGTLHVERIQLEPFEPFDEPESPDATPANP